jgi:hypothetical protein
VLSQLLVREPLRPADDVLHPRKIAGARRVEVLPDLGDLQRHFCPLTRFGLGENPPQLGRGNTGSHRACHLRQLRRLRLLELPEPPRERFDLRR